MSESHKHSIKEKKKDKKEKVTCFYSHKVQILAKLNSVRDAFMGGKDNNEMLGVTESDSSYFGESEVMMRKVHIERTSGGASPLLFLDLDLLPEGVLTA